MAGAAIFEPTGKPRDPAKRAAGVAALTAAFGNRVVTSRAVREQHGSTLTWMPNEPPDAVVFPQGTEDVQRIVRICSEHGLPIIPFGVGSSLEGHVNAPQGGVSVDFRDMNKLVAVHAEDLDCVVEPGITRKTLNEQLRDSGLFFPIDPGADASLGGMASTRASGTNAVRYGTMKDNVLSLQVVLANGEVINTATRAKKTSAGYDLTRLMVGSEGTLGIITQLTLKLSGIPEAIAGGTCPFPSVEACCNTAIMTIQSGIPIARIELLDALQVRAINTYATGIIAPIVGHIGDGNFHLTLLVDTNDPFDVKRCKDLAERLVVRALAMDGTCTGEHGVGQGKMKYLIKEHGPAALAAMAAIKTALDPQNLMNPGKIVAL
jgi:D-lactate dehydrogenase (cytochrome)